MSCSPVLGTFFKGLILSLVSQKVKPLRKAARPDKQRMECFFVEFLGAVKLKDYYSLGGVFIKIVIDIE